MTQDERWDMMWQDMMDFFRKNRRRPSKHKPEERDLHNWAKYNLRRMREGKMSDLRVERMEALLAESERLKRVNQFLYKHSERRSLLDNEQNNE